MGMFICGAVVGAIVVIALALWATSEGLKDYH